MSRKKGTANPAMDLAFLKARGLEKRYGTQMVLRGLDFDIAPGECFGLLGPNGAGKSTTVRAIQGLTPLDAGSIEVDGLDVATAAPAVRARMGVVPQMDNLDPDFTVLENLLVYGRYFRLPRAVVRQRSEDLLEFLALTPWAREPISALSGGMKRRLTIARALINAPRILLLDEPSTGLDPQARHLIWQRLRSLRRDGTTLLLTTHYMDEAERLCDRVAILDHGRILALDSPQALIAAHVPGAVLELRRSDGRPPDPDNRHLQWVDSSERVGDTLICYGHDFAPLLQHFGTQPDYLLLQRPASLEDVFLRLTGRDLREAAGD